MSTDHNYRDDEGGGSEKSLPKGKVAWFLQLQASQPALVLLLPATEMETLWPACNCGAGTAVDYIASGTAQLLAGNRNRNPCPLGRSCRPGQCSRGQHNRKAWATRRKKLAVCVKVLVCFSYYWFYRLPALVAMASQPALHPTPPPLSGLQPDEDWLGQGGWGRLWAGEGVLWPTVEIVDYGSTGDWSDCKDCVGGGYAYMWNTYYMMFENREREWEWFWASHKGQPGGWQLNQSSNLAEGFGQRIFLPASSHSTDVEEGQQ